MVLEAALCMALEDDKLKAAGLPHGGCLSPAAAMGAALIDRLRAAGFVWKVEEEAAQKVRGWVLGAAPAGQIMGRPSQVSV